MTRHRIPYEKRAKSFDEQIQTLRGHGVDIANEENAKEYLSDIGYYRLGFYLYPFEITYPFLDHRRCHNVKPGTKIEDVVALYYFDFDLRNILNRYLSRIEVAIRSVVIYELSIKYIDNPTWFVDPHVVSQDFINKFPNEAYRSIQKKFPIRRHHKKYTGQYAPAWKTMEFMTFGNLEVLYDNLLLDQDKRMISSQFNVLAIETFKSYLSTVREVRNACAHGNVLFGMTLSNGIRAGEACQHFSGNEHQSFKGALHVINYLLRQVSVNRQEELRNELISITTRLYEKTPMMRSIIETLTGIVVP